jgi:hypothetical protein
LGRVLPKLAGLKGQVAEGILANNAQRLLRA